MKKFIFLITFLMAFTLFDTNAQSRYDRKALEGIEALEQKDYQIVEDMELLADRGDSLEFLLKQLAETVTSVTQGELKQKIESQEDANVLFGALMGILNLFVVGLSLSIPAFKEFVDKYLSKSTLTLITGGLFAIVATLIGDNSIIQLLTYLVAILGTHFGAFSVLRKKDTEKDQTPEVVMVTTKA